MNFRILAASALAVAIFIPAANAAPGHNPRPTVSSSENGSEANCSSGTTYNLATSQCDPISVHKHHYWQRHRDLRDGYRVD